MIAANKARGLRLPSLAAKLLTMVKTELSFKTKDFPVVSVVGSGSGVSGTTGSAVWGMIFSATSWSATKPKSEAIGLTSDSFLGVVGSEEAGFEGVIVKPNDLATSLPPDKATALMEASWGKTSTLGK